jgi:uncharacterized protein (TIGR00297 family)
LIDVKSATGAFIFSRSEIYVGIFDAMPVSSTELLLVSVFLVTASFLAFNSKKLTAAGSATGLVMGIFIFLGGGFTGLTMLGVFFLAGIVATKWRSAEKKLSGVAEKDHETRTASQVIANSGLAALIGASALFFPHYITHANLLIACCFSSAISDTISSEIGVVHGKRFFNIINFRPDKKGLDGVVSVEGTIAGIAASIILASVYLLFDNSFSEFLIIVLAGFSGNISDSVLGATLERKGYIKNDVVNLLNTFIAALVGFLLK